MLFKFKSQACADLIMLELDGRRILKAMVGDDPVKGIVRVDDLQLDRTVARVAETNKMSLTEFRRALERDELPEAAVLASLGCGNPIAVADLHEGERVLDLTESGEHGLLPFGGGFLHALNAMKKGRACFWGVWPSLRGTPRVTRFTGSNGNRWVHCKGACATA